MRIKVLSVIGVTLLAVSAFSMFHVVYKAKNAYKDLQELQRQYVEEKKVYHVLKAEWSYLNQPERLKKMAARYLKVNEIHVAQIENFNISETAINLASGQSVIAPSFKPVLTQLQGE